MNSLDQGNGFLLIIYIQKLPFYYSSINIFSHEKRERERERKREKGQIVMIAINNIRLVFSASTSTFASLHY